ncbi:MAG: hypothetical protein WC414_04120 [Patescibacteria group bacterium]
MKDIIFAFFLSILLFILWGWIFSFFSKTKKEEVISKWIFALVVIFFFWKEMLAQDSIIIPLVFTIIIILSILFFDFFKEKYDSFLYNLVSKKVNKNSLKKQKNELSNSQVNIIKKIQKAKEFWIKSVNLLEEGELSESIEFAKEAINVEPDFMPPYSILGTALAINKQFDESLKILFKAVESEEQKKEEFPNTLSRGHLLITIMNVYNMQKNNKKALDYAEKALSLMNSAEMDEEIKIKENDTSIPELKKEVIKQALDMINSKNEYNKAQKIVSDYSGLMEWLHPMLNLIFFFGIPKSFLSNSTEDIIKAFDIFKENQFKKEGKDFTKAIDTLSFALMNFIDDDKAFESAFNKYHLEDTKASMIREIKNFHNWTNKNVANYFKDKDIDNLDFDNLDFETAYRVFSVFSMFFGHAHIKLSILFSKKIPENFLPFSKENILKALDVCSEKDKKNLGAYNAGKNIINEEYIGVKVAVTNLIMNFSDERRKFILNNLKELQEK